MRGYDGDSFLHSLLRASQKSMKEKGCLEISLVPYFLFSKGQFKLSVSVI